MSDKNIALTAVDEVGAEGQTNRTVAGGEIEQHEFKDVGTKVLFRLHDCANKRNSVTSAISGLPTSPSVLSVVGNVSDSPWDWRFLTVALQHLSTVQSLLDLVTQWSRYLLARWPPWIPLLAPSIDGRHVLHANGQNSLA